jgi:hypothetical protein
VIVSPKLKEPERPNFCWLAPSRATKIDSEFSSITTNAVLRLRLGEKFQGWKLQSVKAREVAFQKDQLGFVMALPQLGPALPSRDGR